MVMQYERYNHVALEKSTEPSSVYILLDQYTRVDSRCMDGPSERTV
jgi:hypothetical protein